MTAAEPSMQQLEAAARVMCEAGYEITLPWEGSQDDVERGRYEALRNALVAACIAPAGNDGAVREADRLANWIIGYLSDECGLIVSDMSKADRSTVANAVYNSLAALPQPREAEPDKLTPGQISTDFHAYWDVHQKDPAHSLITENAANATWHAAYAKYAAPSPIHDAQVEDRPYCDPIQQGKAFYLAMYENDGANWNANENPDIWVKLARDYERRRRDAIHSLKPQDGGETGR